LFVGLFIVAPQLVFIANEGDHYEGFYMMMNTESEWYYLARMHEFYDEGRIGNPYLFEHKFHGPIFISPGGETILAIPGKLLDISVPTINLIYKFLLPAITFLLLYALIFRMTAPLARRIGGTEDLSATRNRQAWSIAGGLFFLVGSTWLYANNLSHLLRGDASFFTEFVYNRAVHPQFDGVLTFLYLNVLLSVVLRRSTTWFVVLGALLGLSFYSYFYSFTFFFVLNFILAFFWLFFGQKKDAWRLVLTTLGGLLVGVPALWAIYEARTHVDYPQITAYSTQFGHFAEMSKNGLLVSLLFGIYFFHAKAKQAIGVIREYAILVVALLVTTFVVVNQQVLTGVSLHSGHYHHNFNIPIFIILLMFLGSAATLYLVNSRPRFYIVWGALPWLLSLLFIGTGTFIQHASYVQNTPRASEDQRYVPAFSWIEEKTPEESVIMANERISELIPVYTTKNTMWSLGATNYLMPPERARFTPENLLRSDDFLRDIKQYRVDYILWDQKYDPDWGVDSLRLPVEYSAGGITIYKLPE